MRRRPRAFKVQTDAGSSFLMRLDPQQEYAGLQFGRLRVVGKAESTGLFLDWTGEGACEPDVGGGIIVDPEPVEVCEIDGQQVKVWRREEIVYVREIPVPEELLRRVSPGCFPEEGAAPDQGRTEGND